MIGLTYDIMNHCKKYNNGGIIVLVGYFEKAFDKLNWNFISNISTFYNFRDKMSKGHIFVNLIARSQDILMKST